MEYKDYYKILGVSKNASTEEIKSAFRKLAKKYHPDVNPGNKQAEQRFKEINEAHDVLADTEKRQKYDQLGSDWERIARDQQYARQYYGQARSSPQWEEIRFGDGGDTDFSDFFATFFGGEDIFSSLGGFGGQRFTTRSRPQRGSDIEEVLEITLEEAFNGTTRLLQLQTSETCPTCQGNGMISRVSGSRQRMAEPCPECGGTGTITRQSTKRLEVKIPRGVTQGSKIRLAGQGNPGQRNAPAGDLYLNIKINQHPVFEIDGHNLRMEIPILDYEAVLGAEISLQTLSEPVSLKIPAGTQSGTIMRLRGQGLPASNNKSRGDLLVKIKIIIPENLNDREKKLVTELKDLRQQRGADNKVRKSK